MKLLLVAAVALIDRDGRVLLGQRPSGSFMGDLWEYPGGKVEPGETPEAAILRELHEELSIETQGSCLAPLTFASHGYPEFHLLMPLFVCRKWVGTPMRNAHKELRWVRPRDIPSYAMPPADRHIGPILRDWIG
ncbi:MAG: (deoxy)nucleoside triphosphate pyrophosphohydrolase [Rhodobacteraceae bacterium]|nr:(deoxy)nucleoside triphosphate pyrophosphohydrolase [Paracoccaceae bacterium]MCY4195916.1 (deoxy)nucleoside triphosphate pyrophosphohydrolase [Paracoccaceae bacterium]MCY4328145.1 (deoxy)nucleoside triphosphate pyrophosphohydrolase [Paracoccaceae bacterium]